MLSVQWFEEKPWETKFADSNPPNHRGNVADRCEIGFWQSLLFVGIAPTPEGKTKSATPAVCLSKKTDFHG